MGVYSVIQYTNTNLTPTPAFSEILIYFSQKFPVDKGVYLFNDLVYLLPESLYYYNIFVSNVFIWINFDAKVSML